VAFRVRLGWVLDIWANKTGIAAVLSSQLTGPSNPAREKSLHKISAWEESCWAVYFWETVILLAVAFAVAYERKRAAIASSSPKEVEG